MKKLIFALIATINISVFTNANAQSVSSAEEITYELLEKMGIETGYTDSIAHLRKLFQTTKVKNFLEFGLGYSTKYFLDHCHKVISVEFITTAKSPDWFLKCLNLYKEYSNWVPIAFFSNYPFDMSWAPYKYRGSEHLFKAESYQIATHESYAKIDDFYLAELNSFLISLVKCHKIDAALIDPGIYIRGDLVQLLFGKVPIILAHDTHCRFAGITNDVYGYAQILPPDDYEEIYLPGGQGTTIWIIKNKGYETIIQEFKQYADNLLH